MFNDWCARMPTNENRELLQCWVGSLGPLFLDHGKVGSHWGKEVLGEESGQNE